MGATTSNWSRRLARLAGAILGALTILLPATTPAADISWSGSAGTYNNPAVWGGTIPGLTDKAINDNGAANAVQINPGDPDWIVNGLLAGRSTGNGAFVQNGQTIYLTNVTGRGAVRLGVGTGRTGNFTLNGGALNYTGEFNIGELGSATLTLNDGTITGNGNLAVNIGSSLDAVNATMDGGTNKGGHTWFEQGLYTADPTRGLPPAGTTITSISQGDHTYTLPPSYAANNSVFLAADAAGSATITLSTPAPANTLSFLGSSGGGAATLDYNIHFSGAPDETGTLILPDWYPPGDAIVALNVGGRVQANGLNYQNVDGALDAPKLVSVDLTLANTINPITSIQLTRTSGGRAGILALSKSTGADFTPLAITGYNADIVMGNTEPIYVASNITNVLNQTAGAINITGEMFVGNVGAGIYNLSGGTNTVANYIGIGRSGGNGVLNMTGGVLNKTGNGHLIFGTPYQNLPGHDVSGVLNHSGGTINMQSGQVWFPEGSSAFGAVSGTYNLSGTAVMNVGDWFAIGRNGASGTLNMTGGTINKSGGGQPALIIADGGGAVGQVTQSAGTINCSSEMWIGQNGGSGTYNLSGTGALNVTNWFAIGRSGNGANGSLTMTGGSLYQGVGGVFIVGDNSQGTFMQSAGPASAREFWVGNGSGGTGNYDLSGTASLAVSGYVVIGRDGYAQFNMSGGTFTKTTGDGHFIIASGGSGNLNQTGGNVVSTLSDTWVAENGTATWTLSSSATASLSKLVLGLNGAGSGTLNLDGGTVTANEIAGGSGSSTLNFNGGTIRASASTANFLHDLDAANVLAGGLTIDSGTNTIGVAQALLDGGGNGGLTKVGSGTLNLNGVNGYTGSTLVNAGTLGGNGTIAGPVSVAGGATLAPGASIGTLTINNTLSLAGTSTTLMEVSKNGNTNDSLVIPSITYSGKLVLKNLAGVLAVNDTFKLFNAGAYGGSFSSVVSVTPGQTVTWNTSQLNVNGTVRVASAVAAPATLTSAVNGNSLDLSWPAGWRLEAQTNSLSTGLNGIWGPVPGTESVTALSVPIVSGNPTVFYRLVFP